MPLPSLKTMLASTAERKLAAWVASVALAGVLGVVVWQNLFTHSTSPAAQPHPVNRHVLITEKPKALRHQASTPHSPSPKSTNAKARHNLATSKPAAVSPDNTRVKSNPSAKKHTTIDKGNFFVQVGAFAEKHKAQALYQKMKTTYKRAILTTKGKYHAVWVGPVRNRKEADILKAQILKRYKIKGFIVSRI